MGLGDLGAIGLATPSPVVLSGHTAAVYALASWRGGLLSGGGEGLIAYWQPGESVDGRAVARLDDRVFSILAVRGSRGAGDLLAVGTLTGDLYFVDASAKRPPRRWRFHEDGAFGLLQLPPGIEGAGDVLVGGGRGRLSRWGADGGEMLTQLTLDAGVRLRSLAYLSGAGLVAVGSGAGDVHLLTPDSLRTVHVIERAHELTVFAIADAGDRFYTAGRDGKVRAWSASAPFEQLLHVDAHAATVNCLALGPEGLRLASGGRDREVRLWQRGDDGLVLAKALIAGRDRGHAASVNACVWLGEALATAGDDRTIRVWRT